MKTQTTLLILFVSFLTPVKASADPFEVLPGGEIVFNVAATTSGVFHCDPAIPCTGSGTSSITLGSGMNTATLTFHGIDSTFQAGTHHKRPVSLGTIESTGGEMFIFPSIPNRPGNPIFSFALTVHQTSPAEGTGGTGGNYAFPQGGARPNRASGGRRPNLLFVADRAKRPFQLRRDRLYNGYSSSY